MSTLDLDTLVLDKGSHNNPDEGMCVMDPTLVAAFWLRVVAEDECWRWTGYLHPATGYGSYSFRGRNWRAHRLSLAVHGRPVPDGMDACHTCDNRWCVNPAHLYAGTRRQNMADCSARGRHNKPSGEHHWRAKLSAAAVREIRERHDLGESQTSLAAEFGVHPATVSRVVRNEWRREVAR